MIFPSPLCSLFTQFLMDAAMSVQKQKLTAPTVYYFNII